MMLYNTRREGFFKIAYGFRRELEAAILSKKGRMTLPSAVSTFRRSMTVWHGRVERQTPVKADAFADPHP